MACLAIGIWPEQLLYGLLPHPAEYDAYSYTHILTQIQLLCFAIGAVAAFHLWKIYPAEIPSVNLDADWVYRRAAVRVTRWTGSVVAGAGRSGARQGAGRGGPDVAGSVPVARAAGDSGADVAGGEHGALGVDSAGGVSGVAVLVGGGRLP